MHNCPIFKATALTKKKPSHKPSISHRKINLSLCLVKGVKQQFKGSVRLGAECNFRTKGVYLPFSYRSNKGGNTILKIRLTPAPAALHWRIGVIPRQGFHTLPEGCAVKLNNWIVLA